MRNTFGQPITISFTPVVGPKPISIDSIVAVRLYESQPSDDQINDSTNANADFLVGTTSSSDFVERGNYEWEITLPKITQPKVKTGGWRRYYYAINYKYTSTGDTIGQWESLVLFYPDAIQTRFDVLPEDVYDYESKVRDLLGNTEVVKKINLSEMLLIAYLNGKNLDRNLIREEDMRLALIVQAVALCCNDVSSEAGDSWEVKALSYERKYEEYLANFKLHYDIGGDNVIDDEMDELSANNSVVIR